MQILLLSAVLIVQIGLFFVWIFQKKKTPQEDLLLAELRRQRDEIRQMGLELRAEQERQHRNLQQLLQQNSQHGLEQSDRQTDALLELMKERFSLIDRSQRDLQQYTRDSLLSIQQTVDEKLQETLRERLGQSFETVGKQLIEVQKGLGEMRSLASEVGGLKRVLSNVKLRGNVGEVQLGMLLEQMLAPGQYQTKVTIPGRKEQVEYAIVLPSSGDPLWLPVDAKFPSDGYERLQLAWDSGSTQEIELAGKMLDTSLRKMAKDIRDKYLQPPHTTEFGILFLPFESLYAEIIRRNGLVDQLREEYRVLLAGPTTFAAMLSSIQMGYKSLAIQQQSQEVWRVLSGLQAEFEKFGGLLEKAQRNIQTGLGQLDEVSGVRTRAIQRQLKELSQSSPPKLDVGE